MSKIAIISQPDEGVVIDVSGCSTLTEVMHQLASTLQISSEFWKGLAVDVNLGDIAFNSTEVGQVLSILQEVGVSPRSIFSTREATRLALAEHNLTIGEGASMSLPRSPRGEEGQELGGCAFDRAEATDAHKPVPATVGGTAEDTVGVLPCRASAGAVLPGSSGVDRVEPDPAPAAPPPAQVLYLKQTLRSGQAVSHRGHLVILGDVNPGAEVIADGDITVWGALRGIAHAGVNGNTQAEIRALRLQPIQIRIAHAIARSPDRPQRRAARPGPETARIVNGSIRITANNPD